jgi:hypothetical protein
MTVHLQATTDNKIPDMHKCRMIVGFWWQPYTNSLFQSLSLSLFNPIISVCSDVIWNLAQFKKIPQPRGSPKIEKIRH